MTTETVLSDADKDNFVSDLVDYGTDFVAPLYAVVEAIEQAVLQSEKVRTMDGMAACMDMVRQELIEAGIITEKVPPMFVANAVLAEVRRLLEDRDVLVRNGFVRCDIPACNCGSWHAQYGLPERMFEIKDALAEAGHPLCNDNGNLVRNALAALIADRDALREDAGRYRWLRSPASADILDVQHWDGEVADGEVLDSYIDEAMKEQP